MIFFFFLSIFFGPCVVNHATLNVQLGEHINTYVTPTQTPDYSQAPLGSLIPQPVNGRGRYPDLCYHWLVYVPDLLNEKNT